MNDHMAKRGLDAKDGRMRCQTLSCALDLWPQDSIMTRPKPPSSDVQPMNRCGGRLLRMASSHVTRTAAVVVLFSSLMAPLMAGPAALALPVDTAMGQSTAIGAMESGAARLQLAGAEAFKVEDVTGTSGAPLPLKIQLPENPTVTYSFLMFRNMPPMFTLSSGFGTKDYWAASLHDIEGLRVIPPDGYEGSFTMEVLLVKGVGADPERRMVKVAVTSKGSVQGGASSGDETKLLTSTRPDETTAALPPLNPPRQPRPQGGELTDIEQSMMERGDTYLKQGDIAAARLLYRQLAKKGIAAGAFAMGNTYDPEFLATLRIRGLQPDVGQAKNWYRMAEELGSTQAAQRLATLNAQGN